MAINEVFFFFTFVFYIACKGIVLNFSLPYVYFRTQLSSHIFRFNVLSFSLPFVIINEMFIWNNCFTFMILPRSLELSRFRGFIVMSRYCSGQFNPFMYPFVQ